MAAVDVVQMSITLSTYWKKEKSSQKFNFWNWFFAKKTIKKN